ncbi:addiction module antidote protein [Bradyrhizobium sp. USDA 10063]
MVRVKDLKKFDPAEYLATPEAQAEYIAAVLEDGSPDEIREAIKTVARARGMAEIARAAGITREGLYKALGDSGNPEFSTVLSIMRAMGMKLTASAATKKQPPRKRARAA